MGMTEDLLEWFDRVKRDLPWRGSRTPYRVWLSEVMLQQTQVATVIPYFERWLKRFPDVHALADAPLDDVLKAWEGLGYYRRARSLHRAAQLVAYERNGVFPDSYEGWLTLPGVGPYTAAATASIVNGAAVVAVDGNVKRVAARLFLVAQPDPDTVRDRLSPYLSRTRPGDFNEALMELGATLCGRAPRCLLCPVQAHCGAFAAGRTAEFPAPKRRAERPHYERYALVDIDERGVWLRQRSEDEMLGGLWGFILSDERPEGEVLTPVEHAYTHFSQTVTPVLTSLGEDAEGERVEVERLDELALSTLDKKIWKVLALS